MGMLSQIKDAMRMRSEAKRIEAEIKKISTEYSNGGITVVAKGDMTIERITIAPVDRDVCFLGNNPKGEGRGSRSGHLWPAHPSDGNSGHCRILW